MAVFVVTAQHLANWQVKKEEISRQNWMDVIQLYDSLGGPQLEELGTSNSPTDLVGWNEPKELYLKLKGKQSLSVEVTISKKYRVVQTVCGSGL